jgi:hypothetical protein
MKEKDNLFTEYHLFYSYSSNLPTPYQTIELEFHPVDQPSDFPFESDDVS